MIGSAQNPAPVDDNAPVGDENDIINAEFWGHSTIQGPYHIGMYYNNSYKILCIIGEKSEAVLEVVYPGDEVVQYPGEPLLLL